MAAFRTQGLCLAFIHSLLVGSALLIEPQRGSSSVIQTDRQSYNVVLQHDGDHRNSKPWRSNSNTFLAPPSKSHHDPSLLQLFSSRRPFQVDGSNNMTTLATDGDEDGKKEEKQLDMNGIQSKTDFESIHEQKNNKYIMGLMDNLSAALDRFILSGSKSAQTQAHNIVSMIESQAQNPDWIDRAHRMCKRAGMMVSPRPPKNEDDDDDATSSSSTSPPNDSKPTRATTTMNSDAQQRKQQAEERLKWEEYHRKKQEQQSSQDSAAEGRSALSRRKSVNGKPDIVMENMMGAAGGLNAIGAASNDKADLERAMSSSPAVSSVGSDTGNMMDQDRQQKAADKVAELVAQAGAASAFHGESLGIGGLDDVLAEVRRRVWTPLAAPPRLLQELGICPVRGLLLYGKPGNGKTLLARKLGQILSPLRPVTVVSGPEVLDKFVGSSEKNLREIFDHPPDIYDFGRLGEADGGTAVAQAALHVVVMDEFDAIARRRGGRGGTGGDQSDAGVARDSVVNQLLAKMDGVDPLSVPTLVIGLTNKRSLIDPALLRPGRFEVQVEVPPPRTTEQRMSILKVHTQQMYNANRLELEPTSSSSSYSGDHSDPKLNESDMESRDNSYENLLRSLAEQCTGFSGASLAGLARAAASHALERAVDDLMRNAEKDNNNNNNNNNSMEGGSARLLRECKVTWSDFEAAIQDMRSDMGESDFSEDSEEDTGTSSNDKEEEEDDDNTSITENDNNDITNH